MKKLGFGAMRLPLKDETNYASVDQEEVNKMIDKFMKEGFTYLIQLILIIMELVK